MKTKTTDGPERPAEKKEKPRAYSFLLEFRCRGNLVCSAKTDELPPLVKIGRSPDNQWIIPPEDRVSAEHQAELRLLPGEIRIQACGKQCFYVHGERMTSWKLRQNDRIASGDCELYVKPAGVKTERSSDVHRLEFQNGPRRGEMVRLEKSAVRIGSAPDNDIVIRDDVVSRHHAEIRIAENGETWLKDLNSINGTFVNGAKMGPVERMLMDSDIVSIAFFDLKFLDRSVPHTRSQIGKKLVIMGGTVLFILLAFVLFYTQTPESVRLLAIADYYTRNGNFKKSRDILAKMPESRGFQQYEKRYYDYLVLLDRYEKTANAWQELQGHLGNSEWADAVECFSRLELDNRLAWNWNDSKVDGLLDEVRHVKRLFDFMFRLNEALSNMEIPPEAQKAMLKSMKDSEVSGPDFGKDAPKWLQPMTAKIKEQIAELRKNAANFDRLERLLDKLPDCGRIDCGRLISDIGRIKDDSSGSVRLRAQEIREVLEKLDSDIRFLKSNQAKLCAMDFDGIVSENKFVPADECLVSSGLSGLRAEIAARHEAVLRNAASLRRLRQQLELAGAVEGKLPPTALRFASAAQWDSLLELSFLSRPMPRRSGAPVCEYDRMLGIRFFYDVMLQSSILPTNLYTADTASVQDFIPECVALAGLCRTAEETLIWLNLPENAWMKKDRIAAYAEYCRTILDCRSKTLAMLDALAEKHAGTRGYFIAKAARFFLSPAASVPKQEMDRYAAEWKKFRRRQQALLEQYNPLETENVRKIRNEILKNGIPGDPAVIRFWDMKQGDAAK